MKYFLSPISGSSSLDIQRAIFELNQRDIKKATKKENENRETSNNLHSATNELSEQKNKKQL